MATPAQFDPDAFMAQQNPAAFDPDAFMKDRNQPGFWSSLWEKANPVSVVSGIGHSLAHPLDSLKSWQAQSQDLHDKAEDALNSGDYEGAAVHGINFLANVIPGLGKAMDDAATAKTPEEFRAKLGTAVGTALSLKEIEAAPSVVKAAVPAAVETVVSAAPKVSAAAKAGGKDMAFGAGKVAAGTALLKTGGGLGESVGGYELAKSGVRQFGKGAKNAYTALKQPADLQTPPSVEGAQPSIPSPYIAGGRTQDPSAVATPPPMQGPSLPPGRIPPVQTGTVQVPPTLAPRADLTPPPSVERMMAAQPSAPESPVAAPHGSMAADPALVHAPGDAVIPGNGREQIYSNIGAQLGDKIANAAAAKDIAAADYLRNNHGITGDQFLNAPPAQRDAWLKIERHPTRPGKSRYGGFSSTAAPGTPDYNARLQRFAQLLDAQPPPAGGPVVPLLPGVEQPGVPPAADVAPLQQPASTPAPQPIAATPSVQPLAEGHTTSVYTPNETKADVQYQLVSAPQLRTSFMPGGDPEFQPRSTDRIGSRQRIEELKGTMNPEKMGESVNAGDGAPIMVPDGQLLTRNHGTQALNELYATPNSPKAAEYKAWLQSNAQRFGIDPAVVASEPQPILVRKILTPGSKADYAKFAEEANMSSVARMSDAEQAEMLAKRITGPVMDAFSPHEDGTPNPEFVQALLTDLPPQERAAFMDSKGNLSQSGVRTIRNALFAKAYPDTSGIERMAESTDSNVRNISNGMLAAAPRFAQLQDAVSRGDRFDLGIAQDAARAAEVLDTIKDQGITPQQWLSQENLFGRSPVVDKLVETFAENRRSPRRIGDVLKAYTDLVDRLGSPKQTGLFGAEEPPNRAELIEAANEIVRQGTARNAANAEAAQARRPVPQGAPARGGSLGSASQAGSAEAGQPQASVGNTEPGMPPSPETPRNPYR